MSELEDWDGVERRENYQAFTKEEKKTLLEDVKTIKVILTGNGHPEEGLVFKVNKNTDFIGGFKKMIWLLVGATIGIPATVYGAYLIEELIKKGS